MTESSWDTKKIGGSNQRRLPGGVRKQETLSDTPNPNGAPHETPDSVSEQDYWAQFPDTLTTTDVAKIIRTGVQAVRARLRRGTIPGHRIGDTWIIFKPEIRTWLASTSNQHRPGDAGAAADVLADYPDELNYRDLMRLFGVKYKGTIYIWLEQGHIPGSFVEGRWIVHKWQLRERLDATSNQRPDE